MLPFRYQLDKKETKCVVGNSQNVVLDQEVIIKAWPRSLLLEVNWAMEKNTTKS